jgi:hypothetical protein
MFLLARHFEIYMKKSIDTLHVLVHNHVEFELKTC